MQDGRFFSKYSPGVALLLAPAYLTLGADVALWLTPLLSSLTLWLLFLWARELVSAPLAALGVAAYAAQPDAAAHALNWGAHTQVTFFLVLGLWGLSRWSTSPSRLIGAITGLAFGAIPLIRPPDGVLLIGVGGFVLAHLMSRTPGGGKRGVSAAIMAAVAAIPIVMLGVHNQMAFGGPLTTGYALTNEQQLGTAFSFEFFQLKWRPMLQGLVLNAMGVFAVLGLAGLVGMLRRNGTRAVALLLLAMAISSTSLYMSYYWGARQAASVPVLRFLLPTFALYVVPTLWLLESLKPGERTVTLGAVAVLCLQVVLWLPETVSRLEHAASVQGPVYGLVKMLRREVEQDSLLIAEPIVAESLDVYPGWTVLDASVIRGGPAQTGGGSRGGSERAHPAQARKAEALRSGLMHGLGSGSSRRPVQALLDELCDKRNGELYWVLAEGGLEAAQQSLGASTEFRLVGTHMTGPDTAKRAADGSRPQRRLGRHLLGGHHHMVLLPHQAYRLYRLSRADPTTP